MHVRIIVERKEKKLQQKLQAYLLNRDTKSMDWHRCIHYVGYDIKYSQSIHRIGLVCTHIRECIYNS